MNQSIRKKARKYSQIQEYTDFTSSSYQHPQAELSSFNPHYQKSQENNQYNSKGLKLSHSEVLQELKLLNIQQRNFKTSWLKLINIVQDCIKFELFQPILISEEGTILLENGLFICLWMRILLTNEYLNKKMILRKSYEKWKTRINTGEEEFEKFFQLKFNEYKICEEKQNGKKGLKRPSLEEFSHQNSTNY